MDELTLERYPHGVPRRERRAKPTVIGRRAKKKPVDESVIAARRDVLCEDPKAAAMRRERRLAGAIGRWKA